MAINCISITLLGEVLRRFKDDKNKFYTYTISVEWQPSVPGSLPTLRSAPLIHPEFQPCPTCSYFFLCSGHKDFIFLFSLLAVRHHPFQLLGLFNSETRLRANARVSCINLFLARQSCSLGSYFCSGLHQNWFWILAPPLVRRCINLGDLLNILNLASSSAKWGHNTCIKFLGFVRIKGCNASEALSGVPGTS